MTKSSYLLIAFSTFSIISCNKENPPVYPPEPFLNFKNFEITQGTDVIGGDVVNFYLTLDFTDGDANLGRIRYPDSLDYNCIIRFYKKQEGTFKFIVHDYFINPDYYLIKEIPKPHMIYQFGPLTIKTGSIYDGELQVKISSYWADSIFLNNDTIKVTTEVIDNDNNHSNIAEIESIYPF